MRHLVINSLIALCSPCLFGQTALEISDVNGGSGDRLGWAAAYAGLVDGDLVPDMIVGAPRADLNGSSSGSAHVISGATGLIIHSVHGGSSSDQLGQAVASVGDIDGDGRAEFLVGAPFADGIGSNSGEARLYDGASGGLIMVFPGDATIDEFGSSVGPAGDVDGDTVPDFIVGAPQDAGSNGNGYARIFSGATLAAIRTLVGPNSGSGFGSSVDSLGDLDGDGRSEVLVGAYLDGPPGTLRGRAYVLAGVDGSQMHMFEGQASFDWLGWSVSAVGDVTGDGLLDIGLGAYGDDTLADAGGRLYVHSSADWSLLFTVEGDLDNENLGWDLDGTDDIDGDGKGDVIVGAPFGDAGRALVVSGVDGHLIHELVGNNSNDIFGRSVLGLRGDANGDGHPDVAVGAALDDDNGTSSGRLLLVSGFQPWTNLGDSLAGTGGLAPLLVGTGLLTGDDNTSLQLTNALPGATTNIILGLSAVHVPFKGGVLVPAPDFILAGLLGLPVDGNGQHQFDFAWPPGLPSGLIMVLQHWVRDPGGPLTWAASNGLQGTTP